MLTMALLMDSSPIPSLSHLNITIAWTWEVWLLSLTGCRQHQGERFALPVLPKASKNLPDQIIQGLPFQSWPWRGGLTETLRAARFAAEFDSTGGDAATQAFPTGCAPAQNPLKGSPRSQEAKTNCGTALDSNAPSSACFAFRFEADKRTCFTQVEA